MGLNNEKRIPLTATHRDMNKFQHHSSPGFELIVVELKRIVKELKERQQIEQAHDEQPLTENTGGPGGQMNVEPSPSSSHLEPASTKEFKAISILEEDTEFYGRELLLSSITEALHKQNTKTSELCCCALYGLGGVGKTRLTTEYMRRRRNDYEYIFFVLADSIPKLAQKIVEIARKLDLVDPSSSEDPSKARQLVLDWLQQSSKRLER